MRYPNSTQEPTDHRCDHHHGHGHRHEQRHESRTSGTHHRPTLERSIVKSARRIRRSGLTADQLQHRIAATVSHADYVTTMRTLRRIGAELREQH